MKRPKTERVVCNLCSPKSRTRWVVDSFKGRWSHLVEYHPEQIVNKLIPVIFNPERFVDLGKRLHG